MDFVKESINSMLDDLEALNSRLQADKLLPAEQNLLAQIKEQMQWLAGMDPVTALSLCQVGDTLENIFLEARRLDVHRGPLQESLRYISRNGNTLTDVIGTLAQQHSANIPKKVLLVSNSESLNKMVLNALPEGHFLDWEKNGIIALDKALEKNYRCVLVANSAESLSGEDFMKALLAIRPTDRPYKVIAMCNDCPSFEERFSPEAVLMIDKDFQSKLKLHLS